MASRSDTGSGLLTPQQILNRLQEAAGRPLSPQEIEAAKGMLPGWENGLDESALAPALSAASQILQRERGGPAPTTTTQAPPLTGGPTGGAGPQSGPFPEFTPPTYTPPADYVPPTYTAPQYQPGGPFVAPGPFDYQPFTFDQFKAPSLEDAKNEPGYQFAMDQGRKALENSAAARGTLRTGGTLKDLFSWGDKFGEQNYGNVFNRAANIYDTNRNGAFTTWSANRDNAAANYATNYGVSKDTFTLNDAQRKDAFGTNALGSLTQFNTNAGASERANDTNTANGLNAYDRAYQGAVASFNPKFESAKLSFEDLYRRWRDKLNATTNIATAGAN